MRLDSLFEQRVIGPTYSSIRSRKQLPFPSGAQSTESALESALVDQLAFSPFVHDLVTQATIRFERDGRERRYSADVFVEYRVPYAGGPERFMIEVKRQSELERNADEHAHRLAAAQDWCRSNDAAFCVLDECTIKTAYLANVRKLREHLGAPLNEAEKATVVSALGQRPSTVASAILALQARGLSAADARVAVERGVVDRTLRCDFTEPFEDGATIRLDRGDASPERRDPLLRILRDFARATRS